MPDPRLDPSSNAPFPTTRWSRVRAAGGRADPPARAALAELCAAYGYPLYAFVRRKGYRPEEAADLVQGTFLVLLDRDGLAAVAPHRGRFRSFLLAVCTNHLADCRDRDRAAKRGGGHTAVPFDGGVAEGRYASEPAGAMTAERLFERRSATSLLEHAVARLETESIAAGKGALVSRLLPTLTGGRVDVPLAAIAAELGMTEGAVKMAVSRLRRRYGEILREEIARTVADPADVEANAQNQRTGVGAATLDYDASGNLTTDETGDSLVYDAWNRLIAVDDSSGANLETDTYDALGRRITQDSMAEPSSPAPPPAVSLPDGGFESPSVGTGSSADWAYEPSGTAWSYSNSAGVAGNGSAWTADNPDAPEGTQVGYLQYGDSTISQVVTGLAAGTYELTFDAAQRVIGNVAEQDFEVVIDGTIIENFTPAGSSYAAYATAAFTLASGSHTIEKLREGTLLGRFFAASRQVAERLGLKRVPNLGGCPAS